MLSFSNDRSGKCKIYHRIPFKNLCVNLSVYSDKIPSSCYWVIQEIDNFHKICDLKSSLTSFLIFLSLDRLKSSSRTKAIKKKAKDAFRHHVFKHLWRFHLFFRLRITYRAGIRQCTFATRWLKPQGMCNESLLIKQHRWDTANTFQWKKSHIQLHQAMRNQEINKCGWVILIITQYRLQLFCPWLRGGRKNKLSWLIGLFLLNLT